MNLYLLNRTDCWGYDDYSCFVICCESKEEAYLYHPCGEKYGSGSYLTNGSWPINNKDIDIIFLGVADSSIEKGVIIASFNAG